MDPLTVGISLVSNILDKIFPDKDKADAAKLEMFKLQSQGVLQEVMNNYNLAIQQIAVNLADAQSGKWYQQWRSFVGWICGFSLGYNYIFFPFISWTVKCFYPEAPPMPALDGGELTTILLGMLGLGAMKTIEKKQAGK